MSAIFAGEPFTLAGRQIERGARAWAASSQSGLAMSAELEAA